MDNPACCDKLCAVLETDWGGHGQSAPLLCPIQELAELDKKKVTVVVYPDEDGGYTAVMPYFSCHLITQGDCLTAQGETAEEALAESMRLLETYLAAAGAEGRHHLEYALLEGVEVREVEVEVGD